MRELKDRVMEFGHEIQLQSRSSPVDCLRRMNSFRVTKTGCKIHFSPECTHWPGRMDVKFCVRCLSGGSMFELSHTSETSTQA